MKERIGVNLVWLFLGLRKATRIPLLPKKPAHCLCLLLAVRAVHALEDSLHLRRNIIRILEELVCQRAEQVRADVVRRVSSLMTIQTTGKHVVKNIHGRHENSISVFLELFDVNGILILVVSPSILSFIRIRKQHLLLRR